MIGRQYSLLSNPGVLLFMLYFATSMPSVPSSSIAEQQAALREIERAADALEDALREAKQLLARLEKGSE